MVKNWGNNIANYKKHSEQSFIADLPRRGDFPQLRFKLNVLSIPLVVTIHFVYESKKYYV